MKYNISKLIANKKKYIFHIIMAIFVLIALAIAIIGSFAIYQYDVAKRNFVDNKFAKTIEISSFNEQGNKVRKLNNNDITNIKRVLVNQKDNFKLIAEYFINFGIPTDDNNEVVFIKAFSDDFFVKDVIKSNFLISKKNKNNSKITLRIPIVKEKDGGYISDSSFDKDYGLTIIDKASILNNYFTEDELIVSELNFKEIVGTMFPNKQYIDIERIYVNVESLEDIKSIASILSENNYNIKHAFQYYNDLDRSVVNIISISAIILMVLLIFTISLLTGLFELMLKNSVGDIAVLKHLGYKKREIVRIYISYDS